MSSLRLFRIDLTAEARLASLRLRPPRRAQRQPRRHPGSTRSTSACGRGRSREIDVQAGLVPPVFGAFPRRRYAYDNPLPEPAPRLPVPDRPARGRGARAGGGARRPARPRLAACATRSARPRPAPGLPLVNARAVGRGRRAAARPRAGVAGRWPSPRARSPTRGSEDDNDGKQVSGRLALDAVSRVRGRESRARPGSSSRRRCRTRSRRRRAATYRQKALGLDVAVVGGLLDRARGGRVEPLATCPPSTPRGSRTRSTRWGSTGRRGTSCGPGLYLAGRAERLAFSEIPSACRPQRPGTRR